MHPPLPGTNKGFTLIEMLTATILLLVLLTLSHSVITQLVPRYQVISAAYTINNLILKARAEAMSSHSQRMVCSGNSGCLKFDTSQRLITGEDSNGNQDLEEQEIVEEYQLPGNTRLHWKRFRGDALVFNRYGISHFQNGSFYICNDRAAKRLVMNWIGRTRLETVPVSDCPE